MKSGVNLIDSGITFFMFFKLFFFQRHDIERRKQNKTLF